MKVAIITMLIFVMFLSIIFVGNSYGQTKETSNNTGVATKSVVFIQMLVHDSNGQLVGYTEGQPQIFYVDKLIKSIEPKSQKTIIKQGEKTFELIQNQHKILLDKTQTSGGYFLRQPIDGDMTTVLYFHHDSFHLLPGDTATILWTVTRSIN